jgi:hypothetical protein
MDGPLPSVVGMYPALRIFVAIVCLCGAAFAIWYFAKRSGNSDEH